MIRDRAAEIERDASEGLPMDADDYASTARAVKAALALPNEHRIPKVCQVNVSGSTYHGQWYVVDDHPPGMIHLQKDGKWHNDTGGDDGYWPTRESAEAFLASLTPPAQPQPTLACHDCGRPYGDEHGFPDLVVPNDVWQKISPSGNEGGLLCPSCICKRLHDAGIECEGRFRSGPLCEFAQPSLDANVQAVIAKHSQRAVVGLRKYGVTTEALSKPDALRHLQEELLDAAVYCEQLMRAMSRRDRFDDQADEVCDAIVNNLEAPATPQFLPPRPQDLERAKQWAKSPEGQQVIAEAQEMAQPQPSERAAKDRSMFPDGGYDWASAIGKDRLSTDDAHGLYQCKCTRNKMLSFAFWDGAKLWMLAFQGKVNSGDEYTGFVGPLEPRGWLKAHPPTTELGRLRAEVEELKHERDRWRSACNSPSAEYRIRVAEQRAKAAEALVADVRNTIPATFYAGLKLELRVKTLVEHWRRAIEVLNELQSEPPTTPGATP